MRACRSSWSPRTQNSFVSVKGAISFHRVFSHVSLSSNMDTPRPSNCCFWVPPWGGSRVSSGELPAVLPLEHICLLMYIKYTNIRPNDDIWQRAARLALYSPASPLYWPQPLGAIRASRLSSAAIRANPPSFLFFFFASSSLFSLVPGCFQEQQKTTGLQAGLFTPPFSSGRRTAILGAPSFLAASLPLSKPRCLYLAHLCLCVINRWKL